MNSLDLSFKTPSGRFNYRVCGIIVDNGRLLTMKDENSEYSYLPGGRVKLCETAEEALQRELCEELTETASIVRPLYFTESFFNEDTTNEDFHEICLYFLVKLNDEVLTKVPEFTTVDKSFSKLLRFRWIDFHDLESEHLYPLFIKREIFSLPESLQFRTEKE